MTIENQQGKYTTTVAELRQMLENAPQEAVIRFTLGETTPLVFWESWCDGADYRMTFREDNR